MSRLSAERRQIVDGLAAGEIEMLQAKQRAQGRQVVDGMAALFFAKHPGLHLSLGCRRDSPRER